MKNKIIALLVIVVSMGCVVFHIDFSTPWRRYSIFSLKTDKERFTKIYDIVYWGNKNHTSGWGSVRKNAIPYLEYLQNFIDTKEGIKTIVDLGCGNWELMQHINIPQHINYLGVDIVDSVIEDNIKKYSKENIKFESVNDVAELKKYKADLLIIKDVMLCWDNKTIQYFIKEILPNFKYAILVNYYDPNQENRDIDTGDLRPLNLEAAPFFMKLEHVKDYPVIRSTKRIYLYKKPLHKGTFSKLAL